MDTKNIFVPESGAVQLQHCIYNTSYNIRLCAGKLMQKPLTTVDNNIKTKEIQSLNNAVTRPSSNFLLFPYDERLNEEQLGFCNTASGYSLDTCGYCGSDQEQSPKVDRCGVCEGDNRCSSCNEMITGSKLDSCGNCLLEDDLQWNSSPQHNSGR